MRITCAAPVAVLLLGALASERPARADPTVGDLRVDGGLVVASPAALPTGTSTGVGAGVLHTGWLAWGARASWTRDTEYSTTWTVTQSDLRLRAVAALEGRAGRGAFALRLGAGGTAVYESRTRNQGQRAGLSGSELENQAWALLPGVDLELAASLRIDGPWLVVVSGGPSVHLRDGGVDAGWIGGLAVAWQP